MGKISGWHEHRKTNALRRWDKETMVVLVDYVSNGYEAMYSHATGGWFNSHATGGWFSIAVGKNKQKVIHAAIAWMRRN